jgi:hypothetical protein
LSFHSPFWFAEEELLTNLLRDEIHLVTQRFAKHPNLPEFFDLPEASVQQRAACFAVLAHRALMNDIYEVFAGRWQQPPSLGDEEKDVLTRTQNLFAADAPVWVLEVNEVAELLPSRIYDSLPEPLRRGGFNASDPVQVEVIRSAATKLSSVEEIQTLSKKVLDQQLQRLERRWSAATLGGSKLQLKGAEGLGRKKIDLSKWMHGLTDKQEMAFSLKQEYGLGLSEIASRMGLDRKTAYEHIHAAATKIDQIRSGEKRKANRAKGTPEE